MGSVTTLAATLDSCRLVLLDTMVISYHLFATPRYADLAQVVWRRIESGQFEGLLTTLTLAEVLTVPAKRGKRQDLLQAEAYLTHFPHVRIMLLDVEVARETAWVRAATGLRTPDAINIAAARVAGADTIITNDLRWRGKFTAPRLIVLQDYVENAPRNEF